MKKRTKRKTCTITKREIKNVLDSIRYYGDAESFEPQELPEPTDALPGDAGKIATLAERVERGEKLWHPDDRVDYEDQPQGE